MEEFGQGLALSFAMFAACVSNVHLGMSDVQFETGHDEVGNGPLLVISAICVLRGQNESMQIADLGVIEAILLIHFAIVARLYFAEFVE